MQGEEDVMEPGPKPLLDEFDPSMPMRIEFDGTPRSGRVTDSEGRAIFVKNVRIAVGVDYVDPEVEIQLVTMPFKYAGPVDFYVVCEECGEKSAVLLSQDQVDG